MSRNIVICLDGTHNEYSAANTNVVKLFEMLDRESPQQLCYYQTGVGTTIPMGVWDSLRRWVVTRLDLAFAILRKSHVLDAYTFLCRYYDPGDRIYIFGFSRGAYTARVLAAMIHKVGLLGRGNEELQPFAWSIFANGDQQELADGFRQTFARAVGIEFLGLWDTVSSVGWAYAPKHFPYTANNPSVRTVRHAMALDERRAYFVQNAWTSTPPAGQDVQQVWFAGVHCDVGGGYPEAESGLAKHALEWMLGHARTAGLMVDDGDVSRLIPPQSNAAYAAADALAAAHESLKGAWWLVEYLPKRIKDPDNHWLPTWIIPGGRPRRVPEGAMLHASVKARLDDPALNYQPPNLPAHYTIVNR